MGIKGLQISTAPPLIGQEQPRNVPTPLHLKNLVDRLIGRKKNTTVVFVSKHNFGINN